MKSASLAAAVAVAALVGAMAVTAANGAAPSSPEEQAATEALNRKIAEGNAAEEARAKAAKEQYEQTLKQQKEQYDAQMREWEKQRDLIRQQYNTPTTPPP